MNLRLFDEASNNNGPSPGLWALLGTTCVATFLLQHYSEVSSAENLWQSIHPSLCLEYCESSHRCTENSIRPVIQQPINAFSSLSYVFLAVFIFANHPTGFSGLFLISSCTLGIGSFLFHASLSPNSQWLDVVGMFATLHAVVAFAFHRLLGWTERRIIPIAIIFDVLGAIFKWRLDSTLWTLAMVGLLVVLLGFYHRSRGHSPFRVVFPIGFIGIAWVFRSIDIHGLWCWPTSSLYQGHAFWHILSAVALWITWKQFMTCSK